MAVVNLAKQTMEEGVKTALKLSSAVASLDPTRMAHGFADLAGKIPIVGGLFGTLAHGSLDLADAFMATAKHLSEYSGPLAAQQADIEIRNIMRDLRRSQELGPDIMRAVEMRQGFQERMQDWMDTQFPKLIKILENTLTAVEALAPVASGILTAAAEAPGALATEYATLRAFLATLIGDSTSAKYWSDVLDNLKTIADNTTKPTDLNAFVAELAGMEDGYQGLPPDPGLIGTPTMPGLQH
jgi:hypothetical protein